MNKEIESIINYYINNDVARDKVKDYIKELKEENQSLKTQLAVKEEMLKIKDESFEKLLEENKELKRNCNIGNENLSFYIQENKELHSKIGISIGILKTWKDFCEVKRKYCIEKDKEHWTYCIEKIEGLEEVLRDSDVDECE